MVIFVCQDNDQPGGQQPILRLAPAEAAIEARPPWVFWINMAGNLIYMARVAQQFFLVIIYRSVR
jgi:hypothetical protein